MKNYQKQKAKLQEKIDNWEEKKDLILKQQALEEDMANTIGKKKKIAASKLIILFLFINCTIIQLFTLFITYYTIKTGMDVDFGPLTMLITAVVSEVIGFAIYAVKSTKENTVGGIVYDTAMLKYEGQENGNDGVYSE